jgi:hypothetical protein
MFGSDGNVPDLIEEEPGQVDPVEADDGGKRQDRGERQLVSHDPPLRHLARRNAT